jgi:hypothetical protein
MYRRMTAWTAAALCALTAIGCGGGGGGSVAAITRTLLSGSESGATLQSKKWRTVSIKANSHYNGTGLDTPCPTTLTGKTDPGSTISCDSDDYIELRSDGQGRLYDPDTGGLDATFDDLWTLSGDVFNHKIVATGGADSDYTYKVTDEGPVGGKQRLRLRVQQGSQSGTPEPDDIGLEFVIEEKP